MMPKPLKVSATPNLNQDLTASLLGDAIRARRTQAGLSLEDAAALCNISKQTLQDTEHGLGKNKLETILQICRSLGIHLRVVPWADEDEK